MAQSHFACMVRQMAAHLIACLEQFYYLSGFGGVKPSLHNTQCQIEPCALLWLLFLFPCHSWLMEKPKISRHINSGYEPLYGPVLWGKVYFLTLS